MNKHIGKVKKLSKYEKQIEIGVMDIIIALLGQYAMGDVLDDNMRVYYFYVFVIFLYPLEAFDFR